MIIDTPEEINFKRFVDDEIISCQIIIVESKTGMIRKE